MYDVVVRCTESIASFIFQREGLRGLRQTKNTVPPSHAVAWYRGAGAVKVAVTAGRVPQLAAQPVSILDYDTLQRLKPRTFFGYGR